MMNNKFNTWFSTFLDEKNLPYVAWEIVDRAGNTHFIDCEAVIETIKNAPTEELKKIKNIIVQIDFRNGDVNHFFRHLAHGIVEQYQEEVA
ncbi:MAG: hypothetical protein KJ630_14675 [Proteobacteria bacterium]|nr:hypothetical protein [Pseudomonadota bacterium]